MDPILSWLMRPIRFHHGESDQSDFRQITYDHDESDQSNLIMAYQTIIIYDQGKTD